MFTVVENFVPAFIVALASAVLFKVTSIVATGAETDDGVYPNIFAWETILERRAALSRNISFANMFILNPR